jgi:hypothetical protein
MGTEVWLERLRAECGRISQSKVSVAIGYSPAVVNQVLKGSYKGDLKAVQKAVEGALMGATVKCPVLGQRAAVAVAAASADSAAASWWMPRAMSRAIM